VKTKIEKYDFSLPLVGGGFFISREQFELDSKHPGAPKDYTYDDFMADSMETEEEYNQRMIGSS
jgi:hypothetical protein